MKNRIWISILLIVAILSSAFAWAEESSVVSEVVEPVMEEAIDFELPSDIVASEGETALEEPKAVQKGLSEIAHVSKGSDDSNHVSMSGNLSREFGVGELVYIEWVGNSSVKSWSTSDKKILSIEANGNGLYVYVKKEGSAKITVKLQNKKKYKLSVKAIDYHKPVSVSIWDDDENIIDKKTIQLAVGDTFEFEGVSLGKESAYSDPDFYVDQNKTWKNSNKKVVNLIELVDHDELMMLEGIKEGKAKISVTTYNGKKSYFNVKVIDPYKPDSVSLPSSITIGVGQSYTLYPTLSPSTARTTFTWSTSSKKYATVSNGVVYGVKKGSTSITVKTANGKKAKCKVKVVENATPTGKDLSTYLGKRLVSSATELGLKTRYTDSYSLSVYYKGSNIMLADNDCIIYDGAIIDQITIEGTSTYNICGIQYGMSYNDAKTKLKKDGWVYTDEYNGADGHAVYYERGNWEIMLEIGSNKITSIVLRG